MVHSFLKHGNTFKETARKKKHFGVQDAFGKKKKKYVTNVRKMNKIKQGAEKAGSVQMQ